MTLRREPPDAFRRRLVGLFALTVMEREGPVHGYGLSERIAQRTEGTWRPGPGSVYPSLRKLVAQGLATSTMRERRREYLITASGRSLLARLRARDGPFGQPRPDLSPLWAEVFGSGDVGAFLLRRLRRTLDALDGVLVREGIDAASGRSLREGVLAELQQAQLRFSRASRSRRTASIRSSRGARDD